MSPPEQNSLWQRLFLTLLLVCIAQSVYWALEQIDLARKQRDFDQALQIHMGELQKQSDSLSTELSQSSLEMIRETRAQHNWGDNAEETIQRIEEEYLSRRNRVLWEGSFFVMVLLGTMGVISKALRESRLLVKRQQNFIASVSHELRTPLTSLQLSADTLGMRAPSKETSSRLADRMSEDVDRLNSMVSQILDCARLEAREAPPAMEPVNLSEVLQHEAHKHHCRLAPVGILLTVHCPKDLFVSANPNDLKSVVSNLLSNAVKSCAAGDGGKTIVSATSDGSTATIKFTDTGLGFEESEGERIFERFYRPGDELRRETTGSGLGLYLVSQLTRAHGGTARAESPGVGLGATITITWPATSGGTKS